ncbi:MAG TPA: tetratricopeptide repeat protein [Gaiellaceae bacterium]|nr:tetratricopeptide repeat protein [Gaiellaceae bacterium]
MAAAAPILEVLPPITAEAPGRAPLMAAPERVEHGELDRALAQAERLAADNLHDDAVRELEEIWHETRADLSLALRHRLALSWAEMYRGNLSRAGDLLEQAQMIVQSPRFDATDRAEVLYRRGCVSLKRTEVAEADSLFTRALETNDRSARPSALLAANAHEWRSRCHQLRRDWEAARRDAERSLELAAAAGDERSEAHALFQASLVAERQRQWLLARFYAEQALALYTKHGDTLATARILNNIGGICFLLGDVEEAKRRLEEAITTADRAGSNPDLAQAVSSLAQVYLRTGEPREARVRAERAASLLAGRLDFLDELGNAQLVVAKALAAEDDDEGAAAWLDQAEQSFAALGSTSHVAAVWIVRGDLARDTGELDTAADLYRSAADALQDFHF